MKRLEREHAKEKQKLTKDKDAGTSVTPTETRQANIGRSQNPIQQGEPSSGQARKLGEGVAEG